MSIKNSNFVSGYQQTMTDKEIYKARAEGLNRVAEERIKFTSKPFLELLDIAFNISKDNSPNYQEHRNRKIIEKIQYRKALIKLLNND